MNTPKHTKHDPLPTTHPKNPMEQADIIQITRDAIVVLMLVASPMMVAALVVGLSVSLLQALTQIQETTLTFVPKLVAMLVVMILALPYMIQTLTDFSDKLFDRIVAIE